MTHIDTIMTGHIGRNQEEYADSYDAMTWLTPEKAAKASTLRDSLLTDIFKGRGPEWAFAGTKLYTHSLSPGCRLCGNGGWSCLFINTLCNAKCFYCPSPQADKGQPATNTLEFKTPSDYADYVRIFNIQGVSFSGGEPFMTFERVLTFLKTLRARVSSPLYIWIYTNGLLVTEDKLKTLRDSGLDEIRFDLSANAYRLDALEKAVGIIPCVTVEIPAIPEDLEQTRPLLKTLLDVGVNHLNLHQLRCTPFNTSRLMKRNYTFLHGPKVTVLETELAALELIRYALDENIPLPINYCAFTFRSQFQRAAALKRNGLIIKAAHEDMTPTGHIRTLSVMGDEKHIRSLHDALISKNTDPLLWRTAKSFDQLFFNAALWPWMDFTGVRLKVSYSSTSLRPSVSFRNPFKEVALNRKKKVVIERQTEEPGLILEGSRIHWFGHNYITPEMASQGGMTTENQPMESADTIQRFETFKPGLAPYY
ncbi:MAG: radical SAM protein [Desulfobacula sp.]|nr:radical SAM protein [Desulfobacula sp.]